jgi:hypothetical protein
MADYETVEHSSRVPENRHFPTAASSYAAGGSERPQINVGALLNFGLFLGIALSVAGAALCAVFPPVGFGLLIPGLLCVAVAGLAKLAR